MTTNTMPSQRRLFSQRPLLLLLVGALAVALVATFLQVGQRSHAAEGTDIKVTHSETTASIKPGTTDTCIIASTTNITGTDDMVSQATIAMTGSAHSAGANFSAKGSSPEPGISSTDLIISREFDMSDAGATADDCSTEAVVLEHRGRKTMSLPSWARGLVSAAAATSVYLAVTFAVTAATAMTTPELFFAGQLISGCVAGFALKFVGNYINGVKQDPNLVESGVWCVTDAIMNASFDDAMEKKLLTALQGWFHDGAVAALEEGVGRSAGHAAEMTEEFSSLNEEFGESLQKRFAEP